MNGGGMRSSLRVIFEIVKKEFYQVRQDKRMLSVSLIAPILQVLLLGYAATTDIKYSNLAVCDMDKTAQSRALIQGFTNTPYFIERGAVETPADLDRMIEDAEASIALVIPSGFGSKLLGHETAQVQVVLDGADANTASVLLEYANQIVQSYSQTILLSAARTPARAPIGRVLPEPRIWFNPDLRSTNY